MKMKVLDPTIQIHEGSRSITIVSADVDHTNFWLISNGSPAGDVTNCSAKDLARAFTWLASEDEWVEKSGG